ncbi:MAG: hypothetical protein ABIV28_00020 [Longimicrobiales bacterium]
MKKSVLLICCIAAACASNSSKSSDKGGLSATTGDWSASLSSRNNSGITGTAGVQSAVIGSGMRISIRGATSGAAHPWHVHAGPCSASGGIMGSPSSYPALTIAADGTATANVTINAPLTEGNTYSVNVHRSASDMGTIVACGELKN